MNFWNRIKAFGDDRYFLLFLLLLADLLIYPHVGESGMGYQWFRLLGAFITFLCIYAINVRRSTLIFAILLAIPVAVHRDILPVNLKASSLAMVGLMTGVIFDIFVIVIIFHRVIRAKDIDTGAIFGALCVYLMAGFAFARLYLFITVLEPKAFYLDPIMFHHAAPTTFDLVFYSFTTMTSVGATGILPVSQEVRSLTLVESILGVLYLAVLVSRLVAMYRSPNASS